MKATIMGGVALALIAVAIWAAWAPAPRTPTVAGGAPVVHEKREEDHKPKKAAPAGSDHQAIPQLDLTRLFEKGYELDPEIQAMAKEANIGPGCLIATLKEQIHRLPVPDGICPGVPQDGPRSTEDSDGLVDMNHPYTRYSDAELESLSVSDPKAAVILARRSKSDAEAREMYERAVALLWTADPLIEWISLRETGGLIYENGVLDVEAAQVGYQIFLIAALIDGKEDPGIAIYRRELQEAGVDLDSIEGKAAEAVADLRHERQALTGGERP